LREGMILRIRLMLAIILTALANGAVSDDDLPLSESFQLTVLSKFFVRTVIFIN